MDNFNVWLCVLRSKMYEAGIINENTILHKESYRAYFDDGMTPRELLILEYGKDYSKKSLFYGRLPKLKEVKTNE